jgi:hypothetical protein
MNADSKTKPKMGLRAKLLLVVMIVVALAGLIFGGRLLWFHILAGRPSWLPRDLSYRSPDIAQIEEIVAPTTAYQPVKDKPITGEGHVVIDLAHNNNLQINDLAPLRDRLQARGVTIETFDGDGSLEATLHEATALIVVAPGQVYLPSEREAIAGFVEDGGLLLLVADPTRPVPPENLDDPFRSPYDALFPVSAVPAINSLANTFGVVYYDDYLYNLEDNAGSYRNVKFAASGKDALTKDVQTVVFFAAHSMRSDGTSLVIGDENTLSTVRSGETGLAAAALTADGRVLALGDITFMTAPYHTVEDNDQLLSNIANWLAVDKRQRDDLDDFPYLFRRPVDLVQASGDTLDPQLVASASAWQTAFEQAKLTLSLRAEADPTHDAILVATFADTEAVDEYLSRGGVTVIVTPEGKDKDGGKKGEDEEPTDVVKIEGMGTIAIAGTTLFVADRSDERVVIVVLAEDMEKAVAGVERLIDHDFTDCVRGDAVTVCSTGKAPAEGEEKPTKEPEAETPAAGSIFIIASDGKPEGTRTGAPEFEAILGEKYDVTVWYTSRDGIPTPDDVAGYDVYIVDTGDYAADVSDLEVFAAFEKIESGGVMFIGAQPLPFFIDFASIEDVRVADASHPLAAGFEPDQILALSASESGVPAAVASEDESGIGENTSIVFRRGPDSPAAGTAVVVASTDETLNLRTIIALFAFYQLPEDAQRTFALNAAAWLMGAKE